jgi:hypothetical protein
MARPRKQEVDYFPHYCDHGKVLFILENHFKNDGYAVFYKLEELLARTEGHCYDCSVPENMEYLLSKMNVGENIVMEIIEKLATMNVIDTKLWREKRIWMQSFVDSISDVYGRRQVGLPVKPELLHTETPLTRIIDDINPQSKVKESKVNKTKVHKHIKEFIPPTLEEAKAFFKEHGFSDTLAERAWSGYNVADWHNSKGKKIQNWMQTFIQVWFKEENKDGGNNGGKREYRWDGTGNAPKDTKFRGLSGEIASEPDITEPSIHPGEGKGISA